MIRAEPGERSARTAKEKVPAEDAELVGRIRGRDCDLVVQDRGNMDHLHDLREPELCGEEVERRSAAAAVVMARRSGGGHTQSKDRVKGRCVVGHVGVPVR